jgi:hypothetical protein
MMGTVLTRCHIKVQDCLFLSAVILLSFVLYIPHLGFYSDDWAFLRILYLSNDQSFTRLIYSIFGNSGHWPRPLQAVYDVSLYWLFGLNPLGYHVINSSVLMSGILLFYWVLRELTQNRALAIAVPMVYGLLPHYATDRFWYAAFQANLSMALYFLSLLCDLRQLKAKRSSLYGWKVLGLVSLLASTLAYEVFVPLFLLNPLIILYQRRRLEHLGLHTRLSRSMLAALLGSNVVALAVVIGFKYWVSDRAPTLTLRSLKWIVQQSVNASIDLSFGQYGMGLPRIIWKILSTYQSAAAFIGASIAILLIFFYLYIVLRQARTEVEDRGDMLVLAFLGLIIAGLGYSYFYDYYKVTTGINNRVAIAASVGIALCLVSGVAWIAGLVGSRNAQRIFFCVGIALISGCGFLINNAIASFWIAAYAKQKAILVEIRNQFPKLPEGSTLILDGFCPYVGPGIVFEIDWDTGGVLAIMYRDDSLRGDVVRSWLQVKQDGISLYPDRAPYPYGSLFVYNVGRKAAYQLTNPHVAHEYFSTFSPGYKSECPGDFTGANYGVGVTIF